MVGSKTRSRWVGKKIDSTNNLLGVLFYKDKQRNGVAVHTGCGVMLACVCDPVESEE